MPNSPQPQGTHREGVGPRPFQNYVITLDRSEGDPAEIGNTRRVPQEKGPDKWATSRTPVDVLFASHKLAVDELLNIYLGLTDGGTVATLEDPDGIPAEVVAEVDAQDAAFEAGMVSAEDGSCSRATGKGTPCHSKAGAGTEHLGEGACKSHEGQPILELASV